MATQNEPDKVDRKQIASLSLDLMKEHYDGIVHTDQLEPLSNGDIMNLIQLLQAYLWNRPGVASLPEDKFPSLPGMEG